MCVSLNQYCSGGVLGKQYQTSSSLVHITAHVGPTTVDRPKVPLTFAIFSQTLDDTANNGKNACIVRSCIYVGARVTHEYVCVSGARLAAETRCVPGTLAAASPVHWPVDLVD